MKTFVLLDRESLCLVTNDSYSFCVCLSNKTLSMYNCQKKCSQSLHGPHHLFSFINAPLRLDQDNQNGLISSSSWTLPSACPLHHLQPPIPPSHYHCHSRWIHSRWIMVPNKQEVIGKWEKRTCGQIALPFNHTFHYHCLCWNTLASCWKMTTTIAS